jgi:uncharacterized membrane protein YtjA (UPF0391 family)
MLNYIITFFILALISGLLGFGGMAADFAGVAQLLTFVFIILFLASVVDRAATDRK